MNKFNSNFFTDKKKIFGTSVYGIECFQTEDIIEALEIMRNERTAMLDDPKVMFFTSTFYLISSYI